MIESTTRSILRSGDSRGVALSPKWLERYKPTRLNVVHVNGFVLVFPVEQASFLENNFGKIVAKAVEKAIIKNQLPRDQESEQSDPSGKTE